MRFGLVNRWSLVRFQPGAPPQNFLLQITVLRGFLSSPAGRCEQPVFLSAKNKGLKEIGPTGFEPATS